MIMPNDKNISFEFVTIFMQSNHRKIMKKSAIFILFIVFVQALFATDYHVSNSGNPVTGDGTLGNPWATIDQVNSNMSSFNPGDKILFESGGIFEGTLVIGVSGNSSNPITFGAYGTGDKPVIKASKEVTGWVQNGNIWTADCPDCPETVTNLFIDDKFQPMGRYPNSTYRTVTGGSGSTVLIDNTLSDPDHYWDNGEVVVKTARWVIDAVPIASQIGTTLNLAEQATYYIVEGWGYFFQNHINTLDLEGEWAFDKQQKKIHIYSSTDPNGKVVEVTHYDYCINIESVNYINIEELELKYSRSISARIKSSNNINFTNNIISYSGGNAAEIRDSDHPVIDNNIFQNTNNNGMNVFGVTNSEITNNTFTNTAMIPGRGYSDNGQYQCIVLRTGNENLIEKNKFDSTGYNAITFYVTSNVKIVNNFVNHSCMIKDDGSGIYAWNATGDGNEISGNIVLNSVGTSEGVPSTSVAAEGIYIDDYCSRVLIKNNTVAYCRVGIMIHGVDSITIEDNLCYENTQAGLKFQAGHDIIKKCETRDNYFFTTDKYSQYTLYLRMVDGVNLFENNTYCDPYDPQVILNVITAQDFEIYTVEDWQSLGYISAKPIPVTFAQSGLPDTTGFVRFFYNPSETVKTISLSGTYRDLDNNLVVGSVDIEPYSSIILLKENRETLGVEATPTGPTEFCQGSSPTDYATIGTPLADTYIWYLSPGSAGAVQSSGKLLSVTWNASFSGDCNVSFLASGPGNYVAVSSPLSIHVSAGPYAPDAPYGTDTVIYQNSLDTEYKSFEVGNATGYDWKLLPVQAGSIVDTFGINRCTIDWNEPFFGETFLYVRAKNECGSGEYSDSLVIKVLEVDLGYGIINVFTPNGDGFNDYWNIPFIRDFPNATIKIFDANNKLLIEYKGSDSSWNGTVNGVFVPMGNYLYVIELGGGKKPIKGHVTVLR